MEALTDPNRDPRKASKTLGLPRLGLRRLGLRRLEQTLERLLPESVSQRLGLGRGAGQPTEESTGFALWGGCLFRLGEPQILARDPSLPELAAAIAGSLAAGDASTRVCLFLPAQEFLSSHVSLPGLPPAAALAAIRLQADALIPSLEEELALVEQPVRLEGGDDFLCLWMRQTRLDEISFHLEQAGVELVALAPRTPLLGVDPESPQGVVHCQDEDGEQITRVMFRAQRPLKWETLRRCDLEDEELKQQWLTERTANELENSGAALTQTDPDWLARPGAVEASQALLGAGLGFVPAREKARRSAQLTRTRATAFAVLLALVAVLSAIPFALQSVQFRLAASTLHTLREDNGAARADQAFVADFDRRWGPVNEYPQQDAAEIMFTLQRVISPDTLTSLEIDEGLIHIEGVSNNPQAILQRLEQDPLFTEVVFARATNNSRYSIDLRLATVSFEAYRVRHLEGGN